MNAVRAERNHFAGGENDSSEMPGESIDLTAQFGSSEPLWVDSDSFQHEAATPRLRQPVALAARMTVELEYVGSGALKALGNRTGRRYCFGGHGARVAVDARDRPALAAVASLREV